jgi:hypothetical protein
LLSQRFTLRSDAAPGLSAVAIVSGEADALAPVRHPPLRRLIAMRTQARQSMEPAASDRPGSADAYDANISPDSGRYRRRCEIPDYLAIAFRAERRTAEIVRVLRTSLTSIRAVRAPVSDGKRSSLGTVACRRAAAVAATGG